MLPTGFTHAAAGGAAYLALLASCHCSKEVRLSMLRLSKRGAVTSMDTERRLGLLLYSSSSAVAGVTSSAASSSPVRDELAASCCVRFLVKCCLRDLSLASEIFSHSSQTSAMPDQNLLGKLSNLSFYLSQLDACPSPAAGPQARAACKLGGLACEQIQQLQRPCCTEAVEMMQQFTIAVRCGAPRCSPHSVRPTPQQQAAG